VSRWSPPGQLVDRAGAVPPGEHHGGLCRTRRRQVPRCARSLTTVGHQYRLWSLGSRPSWTNQGQFRRGIGGPASRGECSGMLERMGHSKACGYAALPQHEAISSRAGCGRDVDSNGRWNRSGRRWHRPPRCPGRCPGRRRSWPLIIAAVPSSRAPDRCRRVPLRARPERHPRARSRFRRCAIERRDRA